MIGLDSTVAPGLPWCIRTNVVLYRIPGFRDRRLYDLGGELVVFLQLLIYRFRQLVNGYFLSHHHHLSTSSAVNFRLFLRKP